MLQSTQQKEEFKWTLSCALGPPLPSNSLFIIFYITVKFHFYFLLPKLEKLNAAPNYDVPALFFIQRFMKENANIIVVFQCLEDITKTSIQFFFIEFVIIIQKIFGTSIFSQNYTTFFASNHNTVGGVWVRPTVHAGATSGTNSLLKTFNRCLFNLNIETSER